MPNPIINRRVTLSGFTQAPVPAGQLISNDWAAANWSYTAGTGGTATFNPSNITLAGATVVTNNILRYTAMPTALENTVCTCRFTVSGTDATNGAVAMGLVSANSGSLRHYALVDLRNTASKGNVLLFYNNAFDSQTTPSVIPFTNGDQIEIKLTKSLLVITWEVRNVTQASSTVTIGKTQTITYSTPPDSLNDVSYISIFNASGNIVFDYFNYSSTDYKYADLMFIGDSKTQGFYCGAKAARCSDLWAAAKNKVMINLGAQSDSLTHFLLLNPLITVMRPKKLIMHSISNDIRLGTWNATTQGYYASIVSNAQAFGCDVWHHNGIPETVLDLTPLNTYQAANYPANRIVAAPPSWVAATDNVADGVHPNSTGNGKLNTNLQLYV